MCTRVKGTHDSKQADGSDEDEDEEEQKQKKPQKRSQERRGRLGEGKEQAKEGEEAGFSTRVGFLGARTTLPNLNFALGDPHAY